MKKRTNNFVFDRKFTVKKWLIMRLTFSIILLSAFQMFAINTYSQKKVTIYSENESLSIILTKIEKQTDLLFVYNHKYIENIKASVTATNKDLTDVLKEVLHNKNIDFKIIDKYVVLYTPGENMKSVFKSLKSSASKTKNNKNNPTISLKTTTTKAQNSITGKVTNNDGVPLVGVSIVAKKYNSGTTTDFDGNYSIIAKEGDELVFSYMGFISQTIAVTNQTVVNVLLTENTTVLDEVIVSTGYQKIPVERATGSFEKINSKKLNTKINQNILSKIEGEVSGVNFENGLPVIRGTSTFRSDVRPLIVVDGFPVTQDFNTINPNDIETIDVLKDAAAASIWGIRAANGVIVLTTKKGVKNTKPSITYSNNLSITPIQKSSDLPYASTSHFLDFEKHRANQGWVSQISNFNLPPYTEGTLTYLDLAAGRISQDQADAVSNRLKKIDSRNEFDNLFRSEPYWIQHNVSIAGGGNFTAYRAAVTYNTNNNQNSYIGNKRNEMMANLNNSFYLSKKLTLNTSINYVTNTSKANGMTDNARESLPQYQHILDNQGNFVNQPNTFPDAYKDNLVAQGSRYNWDYNLKQEHLNKNNVTDRTYLRLQAGLEYKITNDLSAAGSFQYEWDNLEQTQLYNEETYRVRSLINTFTIPINGVLVNQIPKGHIIETTNGIGKSNQLRFQLNFDKSLKNDLHKITAIAGLETREDNMARSSFTRFGFDPRSLTAKDVAYGTRFRVMPFGTRLFSDPSFFEGEQNRFFSYFANVAYTYQNKYSISGSTRLDDTNLFGASKKYKNIPLYSFGAKWDIAKENFINKKGKLSKLALRATYGSNGSVERSTSPFLLAEINADVSTGLNYAYISNVKNPLLRLEKTFVTNIGIDYGFFNNNLYGSIEYYNRESKDLLSTVTIPSTLGFSSALINVGEMTNTGIDLSINALIINKSKLKYNTTLNFSFNKNEVTKVEVPDQTTRSYLLGRPLQNKPLRYLYSYNYNGLDENGDPSAINENGDIVNVNGETLDENNNLVYNPIQSTDALIYNGTTTPKYYGGWVNTFNFGSFFLRGLVTYKMGHVFKNTDFLDYRSLHSNPSGIAYIHKDFENRWQNSGDELTKTVPRIPTNRGDSSSEGYDYYASGNQFIDSASHIRFTEVVFGYNFSNVVMLNNLGIQQFGISLQARDLGVITFNKWHKDPESILLDRKPTFTLNFNINF